MYGEDYLLDSLAVRLGGRAAELVVIGQGSTGAANDLAGATELATKMVREFGLSDALGSLGYPEFDALTELLLEKETLDGSDVYRLAGRPDRSATIPPVPPTTMAPPRAAAADANPPATARATTGALAVPIGVRTDRSEPARGASPAPARSVSALGAGVYWRGPGRRPGQRSGILPYRCPGVYGRDAPRSERDPGHTNLQEALRRQI